MCVAGRRTAPESRPRPTSWPVLGPSFTLGVHDRHPSRDWSCARGPRGIVTPNPRSENRRAFGPATLPFARTGGPLENVDVLRAHRSRSRLGGGPGDGERVGPEGFRPLTHPEFQTFLRSVAPRRTSDPVSHLQGDKGGVGRKPGTLRWGVRGWIFLGFFDDFYSLSDHWSDPDHRRFLPWRRSPSPVPTFLGSSWV